MTKYITEILDELNKTPTAIAKYKDNYALKTIFEYAFEPELKMVLPEGAPPFKRDAAPLGMSQANFYQQVKKLYIFRRTDISNVRREQLFVQMLESLHPSEAEVCIAIKDQALETLYPNITAELLEQHGFIKKSERVLKKNTPKSEAPKSEGRQLVLNFDDSTTPKDLFGQKPKNIEPLQEATKRGRGRPRKTQ